MRFFYGIFCVFFVFASCDIHKTSQKTKTDTSLTEETETKTIRKGDTVRYSVPKITFRDTVIYTYNRQGTTLKTTYKDGKVSDIDCVASAIELYEKKRTELDQSVLDKAKEKTAEFDNTIVLYIVLGVVVILCFAILLLYFYIKAKTKLI